jgi:hypothetical protein
MATNIHNYTVQESTNIGLGQSGGVTISDTNTHYGRYVAITAITDTVFNALTEEGNYCNGIGFDNGTTTISVGDVIYGTTSTAKAVVQEITYTSGTTGWLIFEPVDSTTDVLFDAGEDLQRLDRNTGIQLTADAAHVVANGATDGATELSDETLKAGVTIYGNFTKIDLTSGVIRAYKG